MNDPWTEGIDCFEDFDEERCVLCIRKDECAFYQPKQLLQRNGRRGLNQKGDMENRIKKLEEVVYLLRNDYMTHKKDIRELEKMVKDLDSRLVYLEEQESSHARADHQREEHLDLENAEGLSRV